MSDSSSNLVRATIHLTSAELSEAVRLYLHGRGFATSDRFAVSVKTTPGDRPFDAAYTEISVTGVYMRGAS